MRLKWGRRRINDDEILTQYGNRQQPVNGRPFKNQPHRPKIANAISLIRGQTGVAEALTLFPGPREQPAPGEGVRYTTAGRMRQAGFKVIFTPTRGNPRHVSVENLDAGRDWTDDDGARFDGCFDDPQWEGGSDE